MIYKLMSQNADFVIESQLMWIGIRPSFGNNNWINKLLSGNSWAVEWITFLLEENRR